MAPAMDWLQYSLAGRRTEGAGSTRACSSGDSHKFASLYNNPPSAPWDVHSSEANSEEFGQPEWRLAGIEAEDRSGDEFEVMVEGKDDATIYEEQTTALDASFLTQRPSRQVLAAYLRKHGLATHGRKEVLRERIKDYQVMKTIGCKEKYARSTFTIDCSSGLCTNDVILFAQRVAVRLGNCSYGYRFIAGRVTRCKYETTQGRFVCQVEVLWSTGHCAIKSFTTLKLTRNYPFQNPILRQPWPNEGRRLKAYIRAKRKMQRSLCRGAWPGPATAPAQPYTDPCQDLVLSSLASNAHSEGLVLHSTTRDVAGCNYGQRMPPYLRPATDFMESFQQDVTPSMRGILIDWLVEVAEYFNLVPETLYLTVSCIDRVLSTHVVSKLRLQLLGVSCLLVAAKYEERCAPQVQDLCYITDHSYVKKEVLEMERCILNNLSFKLTTPTTKTFLGIYIGVAQAGFKLPTCLLECLGNYLGELTLVEYSFLEYAPCLVAAACVFVAKLTLEPSTRPWNATLQLYTGYGPSELRECVHAIHDLQANVKKCQLPAIRNKYRQHKFKCVAALAHVGTVPEEYFQYLDC